MEKLFRENKTSPLLKTPEKDFQNSLTRIIWKAFFVLFSALPIAPFTVGVFSAIAGGVPTMAQNPLAPGFALMYNQMPCWTQYPNEKRKILLK